MGLDAVELLMDVEDAFQVTIPLDEYAGLKTVGDLHAFLVRRLSEHPQRLETSESCVSLLTFLKIRQLLMPLLSVPRDRIRPTTTLHELIPRPRRLEFWNALNGHSNLKLPSLRMTPWSWFGLRLLPSLVLFEVFVSLASWRDPGGFIALIALCGMIGLVGSIATQRFKTEFPAECATVGDLVSYSRTPCLPSRIAATNSIDSEAVWSDLVAVVCSALGVSPDQVKPETRFIEDLFVG